MVMFAETKAQQIAEDGLLSTEAKIGLLCELDTCQDASRPVCNHAPWWRFLTLSPLRKVYSACVGRVSTKAKLLGRPRSIAMRDRRSQERTRSFRLDEFPSKHGMSDKSFFMDHQGWNATLCDELDSARD